MAITAAELRAVYSVDEGPLDRSLKGLGGKVSGAVTGAVGAAAGLFAFDQIKDGFLNVTGAASDLNETINQADTIFGKNAATIQAWAQNSATTVGLSRQAALDAAAGFGDMFSQIGFAGNQAADMSTAVVQMSADLGSFNNLETADVADRMSAAFRGEYDSLQSLIPNINAARVESEAMAATGKDNAAALTAQEKAAAVLAIVNKDGARAMGDFAKTSDGAANSAKIATAEWENQKAAIGQQLLPILTTMIGFVRSTVIPGVGALAGFIAGDVVPALKDMARWVADNETPLMVVAGIITTLMLPTLVRLAVGYATTAAAAVVSAATQSAAWLATQVRALGVAAVLAVSYALTVAGWVGMAVAATANAAVVVAGWVLMGAQSMLQGARMAAAWVLAMGPVGWVIAAVAGLVALIVANWDTVVSWTRTAWGAVAGAIGAAWEWIKGAVKAGIDFLVNLFLNFTGPGLIIKHWDTIKNFTVNAWNAVTGAVSGAWNNITSAISSGIGNAVSFVRELPGRVVGALGNLGSTLYNAGKDLIQGLINGAGSLLRNIGRFFLNLVPGWIRGPFEKALGISSPSKVFAGFGENIGQGLINGLAGMRPAVAAEMLRMADTQALGGMLVSPPAGVGGARGTAPGTAMPGAGGPAGGGYDALLKADTINVIDGTPDELARKLSVEMITRGR